MNANVDHVPDRIGRRVLVIGTSGSGKSSFATRLAAAGLAHLELVLINWPAGRHDRSLRKPAAVLADVDAATRDELSDCRQLFRDPADPVAAPDRHCLDRSARHWQTNVARRAQQ